MSVTEIRPNMQHWQERVDLAAAFRWTARLNMHEAVANHFSLAVDDQGTRFLMNPNQMHFARIRASDMIEVDLDDPTAQDGPDAPDPTAWGLHGGLHRHCPQARCVMHVHSIFATVLASLADSRLPPIDQNCATFFGRYVIDEGYGGLAFEDEGERCARLFTDPKQKVMIMGNHGVLVIGATVADTFNRLYYFERAAETYIRALQTGRELRVLSDEVADKVAREVETYPEQDIRHFAELKAILDSEGSDYAA
ncbi:class II aldolase and adducin N-terminal domain-containing protein [Marinovum algicola]|jgi:ribulose-5-phosphate 4-epimerase/fuculose-1-phosphate aldolase|uniref:class II aldolase and adducin N-terminal domain-containing protein n=1 Tax=Marinovum algicola TaxID=42444 RepID=UPI0024BB1254|nr:class II aldolase and adducin N-terminal domain-containing protein [Marinovum algicola]